MQEFCLELTGGPLINGYEFENSLKHLDNISEISDDTIAVKMNDGRTIGFTFKNIGTEIYNVSRQIIASDITQLDLIKNNLESRNKQLRELNERAVEFGKAAAATTIQHEILSHKINVHNNLGEILARTSCKAKSGYTSVTCTGMEFYPVDVMREFDKVSIDADSVSVGSPLLGASGENSTEILIAGAGTVMDENGATITVNNGEVTGTMNYEWVHLLVGEGENGEPTSVTYMFKVADENKFEFTPEDGKPLDVAVKTNGFFGSASADSADGIVIEPDKGMKISGNDYNYRAVLSSKSGFYETAIISGKTDNDASFDYDGKDVIANGIDSGNSTVTIFSDLLDGTDYILKDGFKKICIRDKGNGFGIFGSSKDNDDFDVDLLSSDVPDSSAEDTSVDAVLKVPADATVKWRYKVTVSASVSKALPDGYSIQWYDAKDKKVSGQTYENGVASFETGETKEEATYTAKVIGPDGAVAKDKNGNELTKVVKISVNFGFFTKIISFFACLFKKNTVKI